MKKSELPLKKILAIDYGQKFTGFATFKVDVDPYPLMFGRVKYQSDKQLVEYILEIIEEEFIDILVIGVPFFTDGKESTMTKTVREFIKTLQSATELKCFEIDETLTTFEAEERMKSDPRFNFQVDLKQIDALSAVIILEEFLKNFSD